METEAKAPVVAKKVWNILRLVPVMLRKGIAKSKIALELHILLKRGKLAGKAIADSTHLILHHHFAAAFASRSKNNHHSFIPTPREYEFSCSNSPAYPFASAIKRKHKLGKSHQYDDLLNNDENSKFVEASPLVTLPGFGKSPIGKQLRVTDSPFPVKVEGDSQVDKAAEEFIKKFYRDLNLQETMAVLDSPCPNKYLWDRRGIERNYQRYNNLSSFNKGSGTYYERLWMIKGGVKRERYVLSKVGEEIQGAAIFSKGLVSWI